MKKYVRFAVLSAALSACGPPPPADGPFTPPPAPPPAPEPQPEPPAAPSSPEPQTPQTPELPSPTGAQTPRAQICPGGEYAAAPVTNNKATLLKDGFVFVEGPVWSDRLAGLLFSEMDFGADTSAGPPSKIHLLTTAGQLFTFLDQSGSNGLAVDETGLVGATHDHQAVSRFDLGTKERSDLVAAIEGKKFNSPNDLTLTSAGDIFFTDPDWQLGARTSETGMTGVYWLKPDKSVSLVDGKLKKPNGVALSPDEKTLYVGSLDGVVWAYPLTAGKPGARRQFAKIDGPDGMAIDCAGNLYVASHGAGTVEVLSPGGKKLASIEVAPKTTNAAFGGPDRKTLYITAGTGVYAVAAAVPGYPY